MCEEQKEEQWPPFGSIVPDTPETKRLGERLAGGWNHRLVKRTYEDGCVTYGFVEAWYSKRGKYPTAVTENFMEPFSADEDGADGVIYDLASMIIGATRPVISYETRRELKKEPISEIPAEVIWWAQSVLHKEDEEGWEEQVRQLPDIKRLVDDVIYIGGKPGKKVKGFFRNLLTRFRGP